MSARTTPRTSSQLESLCPFALPPPPQHRLPLPSHPLGPPTPLSPADVYFPKRKDTFRRRPFCFVTFSRLEDAQRALAESPMNICGIPIKQLNLVEDRADYYKHRHQGGWVGRRRAVLG